MKFAWKIFFISFIIIILSFGVGGFLLINSVFTTSLNNKIQSVCDSNAYITSSLYAVVQNNSQINNNDAYLRFTISNFAEQVNHSTSNTTVNIGGIDSKNFYDKDSFLTNLYTKNRGHVIIDNGDKKYIQAVSRITFSIGNNYIFEEPYYIESISDITDIYQSRDSYCRTYQIILIGVALFASILLVIFSHFITKPLVKLSAISKEITEGDFSKRAQTHKGAIQTKEISELSYNFNTMAQYVEDYIEQLERAAQSRDDFVADFTHELKTPLTSVIGYADMLRSYQLDDTQRRECADFIYKEGKRLESLSLNLLNLIVLKNDSINLVTVNSDTIISETGNSVLFLLKKYSIQLETDFEHTAIKAEPSLLKTLLYNLIDNACKASKKGQTVSLTGYVKDGKYLFSVSDNGTGIPQSELDKITEPFYMVDKSRARSMGGAGLGLALCNEIAKLHGSVLNIDSVYTKGTTVSFTTELCGSEEDYGCE